MTAMSEFSSYTMIIPVWVGVFAIAALFGPPLTFYTGMLLLIGGIVPPVIMFVLHRAERSPKSHGHDRSFKPSRLRSK